MEKPLSDNKKPLIEFFYLADHPPFICGVNGWICLNMLMEIENQASEDIEETFKHGDGHYQFEVSYVPEDRDGPYLVHPSWWNMGFKKFFPLKKENETI